MTDFPPAQYQDFVETADPSNVAPRVTALRKKMAEQGVDAFLVPRADVHRGESVPPGEQRLGYVSGFTGSAGLAVIGAQKAALFVDGRYTIQAPAQTDTSIIDVKNIPDDKVADWISQELPEGARVAFDPWLHTPCEIKSLREGIGGHAELVPGDNLVDAVWTDRPAPPMSQAEILGLNRAGMSVADKLTDLQKILAAARADSLVLTLPESICWLFNIRGRDVPNTPFVLGFAIVPANGQPELFVATEKFSGNDRDRIAEFARVSAPEAFQPALEKLGSGKKAVWVDPATAPEAVGTLLAQKGASLIEKTDPALLPKSKKNDAERAGMREAHARDGVAMVKFLHWFDQAAPNGTLTEIQIASMLEAFRREDDTLVDIGFDTISGSGPNGALPHYRVNTKSDRTLAAGEIMLVDSGGQYLSGTTDITRTMATGPVTAQQKDHYTRVLKGMIDITLLKFPKGTSGSLIDAFARQALWQVGLNFNHGTGHGVGAFLAVHEGPIGIAPRYTTPFEPGMITSNEPGFYLEGQYGIRIENLLLVVADPEYDGFMSFETLTLCPIDTRLIDVEMLTPVERDWLNTYHQRVHEQIGPKLDDDVKAWLEAATQPI